MAGTGKASHRVTFYRSVSVELSIAVWMRSGMRAGTPSWTFGYPAQTDSCSQVLWAVSEPRHRSAFDRGRLRPFKIQLRPVPPNCPHSRPRSGSPVRPDNVGLDLEDPARAELQHGTLDLLHRRVIVRAIEAARIVDQNDVFGNRVVEDGRQFQEDGRFNVGASCHSAAVVAVEPEQGRPGNGPKGLLQNLPAVAAENRHMRVVGESVSCV